MRACPPRRFRSPNSIILTKEGETKENLRSVGRRFPVIRSPSSDPPMASQERSSLSQTRERKGRTDGREWRKKEAKGNRRTDGRTTRPAAAGGAFSRRSLVRLADLRLGPFFRFLLHEKAALALTELEGRKGRRTAESKGFPLISPPLSREAEAEGRSKSLFSSSTASI